MFSTSELACASSVGANAVEDFEVDLVTGQTIYVVVDGWGSSSDPPVLGDYQGVIYNRCY